MSPVHGWGLEPAQGASERPRSAWSSGPWMAVSVTVDYRGSHPAQGCHGADSSGPSTGRGGGSGEDTHMVAVSHSARKMPHLGSSTQAHLLGLLYQKSGHPFIVPFPPAGTLGSFSHEWSSAETMSAHQKGSHNLESEKRKHQSINPSPPSWCSVGIY